MYLCIVILKVEIWSWTPWGTWQVASWHWRRSPPPNFHWQCLCSRPRLQEWTGPPPSPRASSAWTWNIVALSQIDSFTSQYLSSTLIFQRGVMDDPFFMSLCQIWYMKSYLRDLGFRLLCESDFESSEKVVFRSKSDRDFSLSDLSLVSTLLPLPRTWRGSSTLSSSTSLISSKVTGCVLPRPRRSVFFLTVLLWIRGQSSRSRLLFSKPCNIYSEEN